MHRKPSVVIQKRKEVRGGGIERDLQRPLVDRLDTDLREVIELAQAVILSTFHHEQHVGILGCQRRRENALERLHKVIRRDRVTVRPLGVASQVKRVHRAVIGNLPPLRRARHRMKINRVFRDQPLRQCNDDVMLRHAGDHVRIDVLRLGANRNVQHLVRCALIDRLVAGAATGQNADQQAKRATSEDSICHCWEMFWVTPAKPLAKRNAGHLCRLAKRKSMPLGLPEALSGIEINPQYVDTSPVT